MYSREPKEAHRDTIDYEIRMLNFCARRLPGVQEDQERYLFLEGFLLHYRNLIRFFSGMNHRKDDLSAKQSEVWTTISNPTAIQQIKDSAKTLDYSYHDDISKYLQHCTEKRSDVPKNWDVEKMTQEMASIAETFQNEFPESGSNQ